MGITKSFASIIVFVIMVLATIPACAPDESGDGFKTASEVTIDPGQIGPFNYNTSYVISINYFIPDREVLYKNLKNTLAEEVEKEIIDKILLNTFVSQSIDTLQITIGSRVPVSIAQAVIKVYSQQSSLPIIINIKSLSGELRHTERIYVGSLGKNNKKPISQEKIDALLSDEISHDEFIRIVSELN